MLPLRTCTGCASRIDMRLRRCPLCGRPAPASAEPVAGLYPDYQEHLKRLKWFWLRRIILFSILAALLILPLINGVTFTGQWWVLGVLPILAYALITSQHTVFSHAHVALKIVTQVFALSSLLALIDLNNGWTRWSVDYLIPLLIIAGIVSIIVISLFTRVERSNFLGYLFGLTLIGLAPFALYLFGITRVLWPSLTATLLALCAIFGMTFFSFRHVKHLVVSRLHF